MTDNWTPSAADSELLLRTDVTGKAARTGHRLTIEIADWNAEVIIDDHQPVSATLTVVVDSLQVRSGEGGLTPLSTPERAVARTNALKSLKSSKFPTIDYRSTAITPQDGGYRIDGELTICGVTRAHPMVALVAADRSYRVTTAVRQTDFSVKPYSLMMGALKVADEVAISITGQLPPS